MHDHTLELDQLEGRSHPGTTCNWDSSSSARLVVKTTLSSLEDLTAKDCYEGQLTTDQIREALNHHMKDFLDILVDKRTQQRGKEEWDFDLKLWSIDDVAYNLAEFNKKWEEEHFKRFKQQEPTTTAPTKQDKATGLKPGVPFLAPPLPPNFVPRPEVSLQLKESLFSQDTTQTGVLVVSAIYGLGGIGKSTLAAALARDRDIQNFFPDGVFWATLGQQPDLLSLLSSWILELRDFDFKPTTPQAASLHLRTLLIEKRAILVVDDVWSPEHFEFFRVGSAGCRVLVTTREAPIRGANCYDLL
ncbi:MAG: NB-ARC domain-containing protein [Hormoscilla sp.]